MTNSEKIRILIEMNGRIYRQEVSKEDYENIYRHKGWLADPTQFNTEVEVKNYNSMLNSKEQKFDDDLFKRGSSGKI